MTAGGTPALRAEAQRSTFVSHTHPRLGTGKQLEIKLHYVAYTQIYFAEDSFMDIHNRRSCRVAMSVPVRVYGIDYRGIDFIEDALAMIVNRHGAKIRLAHQLLPDAEIRVLSLPTGRDSIFRVVARLPGSEQQFSYWGIESLQPDNNIWGVEIPELVTGKPIKVLVKLVCPHCSARVPVIADEMILVSLHEKGAVDRTCEICRKFGQWNLPPCQPDYQAATLDQACLDPA